MVKNAAMPSFNENEAKSSCGKQLQLCWLSHPSSPPCMLPHLQEYQMSTAE